MPLKGIFEMTLVRQIPIRLKIHTDLSRAVSISSLVYFSSRDIIRLRLYYSDFLPLSILKQYIQI